MDRDKLQRAVEALLFASDSPLTLALLAESLGEEPQAIAEAVEGLRATLDEKGRGVQLTEMAGGYLLTTREEFAPYLRSLLRGKRKARLSRASLEALAIIAYKQPVTRPEIEEIRGVDSGSALATLLERDLITIRGRADVVGRPLLYATTQEFLTYFGLRELSELPKPEELKALIQSKEEEEGTIVPLEVDEEEVPVSVRSEEGAQEIGEESEEASIESEPSIPESEK